MASNRPSQGESPGERLPSPLSQEENYAPAPMRVGRRRVLKLMAGFTALSALAAAGVPVAFAQEAPDQEPSPDDDAPDGGSQELEQELHHDSIGLTTLDAAGTAFFVDAIIAMAREGDSRMQWLFDLLNLPTYNTGPIPEGSHSHKFPLANMQVAALMNMARCIFFGKEVRDHTIHEFMTTIKGVGLLMGFTSLAKGIVNNEHAAFQMAVESEDMIRQNPEKVIQRSIYQLTYVAAASQLPLSAFGQAAIGNEEFKEVRAAYREIYLRHAVVPGSDPTSPSLSWDQLKTAFQRPEVQQKNPQVSKRIVKLLEGPELADQELLQALEGLANEHSSDLMVLLMSTACDDTQAAAGDAGPLVGLYQSYGNDFIKAIPAVLPYTLLIAGDRARLAAQRAGVDFSEVKSAENRAYLKNFVSTTWVHLWRYFTRVGPEVSARMEGKENWKKASDGSGKDFRVLEQVIADALKIIDTAREPFSKTVALRRMQEAFVELNAAERELDETIGHIVRLRKEGAVDERFNLVGSPQEAIETSSDDPLQNSTESLADELLETSPPTELTPPIAQDVFVPADVVAHIQAQTVGAMHPDEQVRQAQEAITTALKEFNQLKLAGQNSEAAVAKIAAKVDKLRQEIGPEVMEKLHHMAPEQKNTASLRAVSILMESHPELKELLDYNYWIEQIGPELAETMFVVLLQGLHLPFIISTVGKLYDAEWFRSMPLQAQELFSVVMNDGISMFADNWADCVAHSKWSTKLYFNHLDRHMGSLQEIFADVPQALATIEAFSFSDEQNALVPERFEARKQQFAALVAHLQQQYPGRSDALQQLLVLYFKEAEWSYYKGMMMSLIPSVTGGGKALTGNAPHFTFAAGIEDYNLMTTLADLKKHPAYLLWELFFSTSFAMYLSPLIAHQLFGENSAEQAQQILQERFRDRFPGFEAKLKELEAREASISAVGSGAGVAPVVSPTR